MRGVMTMENVNGANGLTGSTSAAGMTSSTGSLGLDGLESSFSSQNEPNRPREHAELPAPLSEQMSDAEAIHALTSMLSELRQDVDHAMSAEPPAQTHNQA